MKTTLEIYGQYLLNTQINYTCTNLADHVAELSHDSVRRFLKDSKLSPHLVWDRVKDQVVFSESGCIIFDDKVFSFKIKPFGGSTAVISTAVSTASGWSTAFITTPKRVNTGCLTFGFSTQTRMGKPNWITCSICSNCFTSGLSFIGTRSWILGTRPPI